MAGILTGRGTNVQRKLLDSNYNISNEVRDLQSTSQFPFFQRAVVVDVIFNPLAIDEDLRKEFDSILVSSP